MAPEGALLVAAAPDVLSSEPPRVSSSARPTASAATTAMASWPPFMVRTLSGRKANRGTEAAERRIRECQRAAVQPDLLGDDRQPEAAARRRGRRAARERLEHASTLGRGDPGPVVVHREDDRAAVAGQADVDVAAGAPVQGGVVE